MRYIKPLTGLRFLAAVLVYLHHIKFFIPTNTPFEGWLTKYVFHEGFIGVGFFFMLSGFILAHRYARHEGGLRGPELRNYFVARLARIYPLHLLTLVAMVLTGIVLHVEFYTQFWVSVFSNITLTQSFFPDYRIYFAMNSVSWSLCDELFFYALFPVFFALEKRRFTIAVSVLAVAVVLLSVFWHTRYGAWFFYAFPPVRFVDFLLGVGLYRLHAMRPPSTKPSAYGGLFCECLAVGAFSVALWYHPQVPVQIRYGCYYWIPLALLIWSQVRGGGPIARLMSTRVFVQMGTISFAFYMIHTIMLTIFTEAVGKRLNVSWLAGSSLMLGVTVIAAFFLQRCFEEPANRWLRTRFSARVPGPGNDPQL